MRIFPISGDKLNGLLMGLNNNVNDQLGKNNFE